MVKIRCTSELEVHLFLWRVGKAQPSVFLGAPRRLILYRSLIKVAKDMEQSTCPNLGEYINKEMNGKNFKSN